MKQSDVVIVGGGAADSFCFIRAVGDEFGQTSGLKVVFTGTETEVINH